MNHTRKDAPAICGAKPLPPLRPDLYLAWLHREFRKTGSPICVEEWAFALDLTMEEAHRSLVSQAAFARKQARLTRMTGGES